MRKWILLVGILALGLVWAKGDCDCGNCYSCDDKDDSITQEIELNVPVVVKLILDEGELQKWEIDLGESLSNCYAIPNDITNVDELKAFLKAAGDDLVPANSYPFIAYDDNGTVKTWSKVAEDEELSSDSPYLDGSRDEAPAKGSVICKKSFVVEKYTNCPGGAVFTVTLSMNGADDNSGFGIFIVQDTVISPKGNSHSVWKAFRQADIGAKKLVDIKAGGFYDDEIVQWLWLREANPGYYSLSATYTLAAPIASNARIGE